jgi:large subunit ribosomal protein L5
VSKDKQNPDEVTAASGEQAETQKALRADKPDKASRTDKAPKGQAGQKGQKQSKQAAEGGDGAKGKPAADPPGYEPRLKKLFRETASKELKEEFGYKSVMQIPRLTKIVVSMGIGEAIANKKLLDSSTAEMSQITGRKAVRTKAKKSIATFKVRKGMDIGAMVTLRGNTMYEFLDRLINVAMPRIKDFRGANPNAFDGHGNYSLGVTEQIIFPEIDYDKIERVSGMNIAVVTTAKTDQEARSLLARMGMPFRK